MTYTDTVEVWLEWGFVSKVLYFIIIIIICC